jgi:hypothetical protein
LIRSRSSSSIPPYSSSRRALVSEPVAFEELGEPPLGVPVLGEDDHPLGVPRSVRVAILADAYEVADKYPGFGVSLLPVLVDPGRGPGEQRPLHVAGVSGAASRRVVSDELGLF